MTVGRRSLVSEISSDFQGAWVNSDTGTRTSFRTGVVLERCMLMAHFLVSTAETTLVAVVLDFGSIGGRRIRTTYQLSRREMCWENHAHLINPTCTYLFLFFEKWHPVKDSLGDVPFAVFFCRFVIWI